MSTITIRKATTEDGPALFEMLCHKADVEGLAAEFKLTAETLDALISREKSVLLIAFLDGQPAGMANYHYEDSTFSGDTLINIMDLYTVPEHGGKGVAKAMLRHIGEQALAEGFKLKIAPLSSNTRPLAWYQELGARLSYEATVLRVDDVPKFIANLSL
jgi:GNAT superfamily N-acetyltransferase